jgi:hypothetical protein
LSDNAQIIIDWLEQRRSLRLVLLSLSKGASDLKKALSAPAASTCFINVRAWISFSGIAQGTALVSWLKARPIRHFLFRLLLRLQGNSVSAIRELDRESCASAPWPRLPERMSVVHVYGFPLKQHLQHPWAARAFHRLAPLGPNDGGGVLLGDLPGLPGVICPIWGADHYLSPAWDIAPLLRNSVLAALGDAKFPQANLSANQPMIPPATKSQT